MMRRLNDAYWMNRIQTLIQKHSSPVRTKGPNKGHASCDETLWLMDLMMEVRAYIRKNAGRAYDNNMAMAATLGRILVVWYTNVHRAKSLDPRRPVARAAANRAVTKYRGTICSRMADDELMVRVFKDQPWNMPWGRHAISGTFV